MSRSLTAPSRSSKASTEARPPISDKMAAFEKNLKPRQLNHTRSLPTMGQPADFRGQSVAVFLENRRRVEGVVISPPMSASSFLAASSRRGDSFAALMPASVRLKCAM